MLSLVHGIVLLVVLTLSTEASLNEDGMSANMNVFGTSMFIGIVLVVLIQITIDTYRITAMHLASLALSVLSLLIYLVLASTYSLFENTLLGIVGELLSSLNVLLALLLAVAACFIVSFSMKILASRLQFSYFKNLFSGTIDNSNSRLEQYSTGLGEALQVYSAEDTGTSSDSYDLQKYSLHFKSKYIEKAYRQNYIERHILFYRIMILFF